MSPKKKQQDFEQLYARLEEIVSSLEDEQLPLESSIELFTEGVELALEARERLEGGEQKVRQLIEKLEGGFELEDFQPDAE
ncbi:MAG: exodeoxyribonuclease VII small subunit [Candidatus Glassbacteria bacterium]|nr:exodeoxyribonuclease VII small subunit [Candidatus Glassbacteria bacterium]